MLKELQRYSLVIGWSEKIARNIRKQFLKKSIRIDGSLNLSGKIKETS